VVVKEEEGREKYDKSAANFSVSSSGTLLFSWQRIHTPPRARGGIVSGVQFASHPGKAAAGRKKDGSWHKEGTDIAGGTVLDARTSGCESSRLKISPCRCFCFPRWREPRFAIDGLAGINA